MSDLAINSVLAQIRAHQAQLSAKPAQSVNGAAGANFSDTLKNAVQGVAQSQGTASQLATRFELGDDKLDLSDVMIASAKAQVQFRGAVEVRNKLVAAYQDVMNMPI